MSFVHNNKGFSLMEVMCAILILGVALAGLAQGITVALKSNKESEQQTTAALLAAGLIETLRAEGYLRDGTTEGNFGEGFSQYSWTQTITASTPEGLHEVVVSVENKKTGQSIYELRTLLFEAPSSSTLDTGKNAKDSGSKRKGARRP